MQQFANIFVTVGTTRFDELVDSVVADATFDELRKLGCKSLIIQLGHGKEIPASVLTLAREKYGIKCECYRLKPTILDDIRSADLVISHAGAGSCIEVLMAKKPLVVVVNGSLMDNHQTELAEQLHRDGYLLYCIPRTLHETLRNGRQSLTTLKQYERGNVKAFVKKLDDVMGF